MIDENKKLDLYFPGLIKMQSLLQNSFDRGCRQVFTRIEEHDLHPGAFFDDQIRMTKPLAFYNSEIGLFVFFVDP